MAEKEEPRQLERLKMKKKALERRRKRRWYGGREFITCEEGSGVFSFAGE